MPCSSIHPLRGRVFVFHIVEARHVGFQSEYLTANGNRLIQEGYPVSSARIGDASSDRRSRRRALCERWGEWLGLRACQSRRSNRVRSPGPATNRNRAIGVYDRVGSRANRTGGCLARPRSCHDPARRRRSARLRPSLRAVDADETRSRGLTRPLSWWKPSGSGKESPVGPSRGVTPRW